MSHTPLQLVLQHVQLHGIQCYSPVILNLWPDSKEVALQVATQMFLSDAAMEATLNGRAEYARILADLGFISPDYAMSCNSIDIPEDTHGQDAMSGNARVIKAAICAGTPATKRSFLSPIYIVEGRQLKPSRGVVSECSTHCVCVFCIISADCASPL